MNVHVAVISHSRSENVAKMQELIGGDAIWYVGDGERGAYHKAGARFVVEGGALCASRNFALRDAFSTGVPCVQLSDDLVGIKWTADGKTSENISFVRAVELLAEAAEKTNFKLAGCAPTANLFYYPEGKPVTSNSFIVGDFIYVKPCDVQFDVRISLKEDYDYTVEHLKKYKGVVRVNGLMAAFKHRTNKGGAVDRRTVELEQNTMLYLFRKHPQWFIENKRRPNEILLRSQI